MRGKSAELFASWKLWAERTGEHPSTMKRFVQNLEARGHAPLRTKAARGHAGLRIVSSFASY